MKKLRYALEAFGFSLIFYGFKLMPATMASDVGGWIGRTVGPRLAASRKALRNLEKALPEMDEETRTQTIRGMWDNLGRVIAEYPHLQTVARDHTAIIHKERMQDQINGKAQAIFMSAHTANWELGIASTYMQEGFAIDSTYRAPNNPWVDRLITKARSMGGHLRFFPKSRRGGRALMKALAEGNSAGIMIDQKYNEGVSAQFFGREAMTNPIFVQLAQKYKIPLIPVHIVRLEGCRFELIIDEAIPLFDDDGAPLPQDDVIAQAHAVLEGWIKDHPEQWLWLHRRWKD